MIRTDIIKSQPGFLSALSKGFSLDVFSKEILVLECIVAGTSFRDVTIIEEVFQEADTLVMKREPENEHDKFAIALYYHNKKAGYIPKNKNEVIARMMDAGKYFITKVSSLEWEGNWLRIDVKIILKD